MMRNIQSFFLLILIILFGNIAYGQTVGRNAVSAAGETFINSQISISYVLGEAVADPLPNTSAGKFLTAGFSQPDIEVQEIANTDISKSIVLYPNPATGGIVKLGFNHVPDGIYTIDVIDPTGRILQTQTLTYSNGDFFYLPIDVSQLKGGVYFIKVINKLNFQGQVKLIKF